MERAKMKTEYLIIGNSIAGVSCLEAIREVDNKGKITVISDEKILNYSRPLISYYLGKKLPEEKMAFRNKDFYEENKVELLLNTQAEKIDGAEKEVCLDSGEKIKFQKLLISTGGKPIIPSIEGLNKLREGVFTFTKFQDARKIEDYLEANDTTKAVILGAGLIGLKCTEGLIERGLKVSLVELADRILANTFDRKASSILEEALQAGGCQVIKEDTIIRIDSSRGRIKKVVLRKGKDIPTNLLIIAIGVRPNLNLVKDTSINYDKGIAVNDHLQTNIQDIYAAGDVVQGKDLLTQKTSLMATWPVASHQGKVAGLNMAGKPTKYPGSFIMNSVELAGIPTISFGITNPPAEAKNLETLSKTDEDRGSYRKVVLRQNKIVGAIFLGKIERAGIFSQLIKDKIDVSSFKKDLLSDEFGLLVLPTGYRKHLVQGEGIEV